MALYDKASTGLTGFDQVIDNLRLGDNVVWQVDSVLDYQKMVSPYVEQARVAQRNLVYIRFGDHEPVVEDKPGIKLYHVDASKGFELFAIEVHRIVKEAGRKTFYVFDCLTELLQYWHSDLMIGNFFKVTCPFLYELETVAYFAIKRDVHTFSTIAGIRETTQLLIDLYQVNKKLYIHPLKVWQRYSPTMFFPHLIQGQEAICITASSEVAELFSRVHRSTDRPDYWNATFDQAKEALALQPDQQNRVKQKLMHMLIGNHSRMFDLCSRYFSLNDILTIASREVGTGLIGGKSIGMLLARKILECDGQNRFTPFIEPHDSYYLGADIFYTYIVQNGWWRLRTRQKSREGYYQYAPELKEKLLRGEFSKDIKEQFVQMLEYFGQSPIIVRSSSLLEDNFGNAFAGKYESVFCANQGTPEERYDAFEQAVRTVYASTMNEDALAYRMGRGLFDMDEQMAILVQRVSGNQYGPYFCPHIAGVGISSNLYVWDQNIDMHSGMLRMVFGLGTRAVDRAVGDYSKIVSLDDPLRNPPMDNEDQVKFAQHGADIISLKDNTLQSVELETIFLYDIKADKNLFMSPDIQTANRLNELGYHDGKTPYIFDFRNLLKNTEFPSLMKDILALLSQTYDYPVDIEFTANFTEDNQFKVNLLQCRPLQTRGLGHPVKIPEMDDTREYFFSVKGNFLGGNVRLPIDFVVYVDAQEYKALSEQNKYEMARQIGVINAKLKGKNAMLMGPGRWGTTTPSLGVPVRFAELRHMSVICELSSTNAGFMPELSYGSHFFQDLVESGIFYVAIIEGKKGVLFNPERILMKKNIVTSLSPSSQPFLQVIHVSKTDGMEIFSDIMSQIVICK
jgi:pyruvate, water dikinase